MLVHETTRFKNKAETLLMERGIEYVKKKLHGKRYFQYLVATDPEITPTMMTLLEISRRQVETLKQKEGELMKMLASHRTLRARVAKLMTIHGVGVVRALTWALKVGVPARCAHLQSVLIKAAKLAHLHNEKLASVREKQQGKGHVNRATLCVVRKLVSYLFTADRAFSAMGATG